jgi:hypothetical protein
VASTQQDQDMPRAMHAIRILPLLATAWLLALPAAAQPMVGTHRQSGPTPPQGSIGASNNAAPDLAQNYNRLHQRRRVGERVEGGAALILNGVRPRKD